MKLEMLALYLGDPGLVARTLAWPIIAGTVLSSIVVAIRRTIRYYGLVDYDEAGFVLRVSFVPLGSWIIFGTAVFLGGFGEGFLSLEMGVAELAFALIAAFAMTSTIPVLVLATIGTLAVSFPELASVVGRRKRQW